MKEHFVLFLFSLVQINTVNDYWWSGSIFLILSIYPPAYRKYFMSQEINYHLSLLSPPLSLSLFKGRDLKVLTVLTPPPSITSYISVIIIQNSRGGGCFSSNKEFLLWNSVESILNQYDTLNLHYEASNLKTRVKCNQLYMYMRISG